MDTIGITVAPHAPDNANDLTCILFGAVSFAAERRKITGTRHVLPFTKGIPLSVEEESNYHCFVKHASALPFVLVRLFPPIASALALVPAFLQRVVENVSHLQPRAVALVGLNEKFCEREYRSVANSAFVAWLMARPDLVPYEEIGLPCPIFLISAGGEGICSAAHAFAALDIFPRLAQALASIFLRQAQVLAVRSARMLTQLIRAATAKPLETRDVRLSFQSDHKILQKTLFCLFWVRSYLAIFPISLPDTSLN